VAAIPTVRLVGVTWRSEPGKGIRARRCPASTLTIRDSSALGPQQLLDSPLDAVVGVTSGPHPSAKRNRDCQSIVSSHSGTITVEGKVGKGSAFRVELPAAPAEG
jgi:hypothetical protein